MGKTLGLANAHKREAKDDFGADLFWKLQCVAFLHWRNAMQTFFSAAITLTLGAAAFSIPLSCDGADPVFPNETWERKTPAEVGLDAAKLDAFREFVSGRGCVIRHGCLAYSWGDITRRGDVASAAKPVYAHFLFRALEDKRIPSLDEKVVRYEPGLSQLNATLSFKDREITWRHLANQTSCYGVAERPGATYDYNDYPMALFWDLLFLKVYGAELPAVDRQVLRPLLAEPLQCEDDPSFLAFGLQDRPGRFAISPRDFARFGLLYLREGRWKDRQLLSQEHVRQATSSPLANGIPRTQGRPAEMLPGQRSIGGGGNQTDHLGSYSFLWWTNGVDRQGRRHWPNAPFDAFAALGHGGKRACLVIPSRDLVATWNDAAINGREMENEALRLLLAAVKAMKP
jgi:CubicO group peptidase (beta-lactamase class C family)